MERCSRHIFWSHGLICIGVMINHGLPLKCLGDHNMVGFWSKGQIIKFSNIC